MSHGLMHVSIKRKAFPAALFLVAAALHAEVKPAPATTSDFIRFREDVRGAQLQTAIGTYRNAQGVTVDLIGAIHIADKAYYEALNLRFTTCDALLYEMVGEALEAVEDKAPAPMDKLKSGAKSKPPASGDLTPEEQTRPIESYLTDDPPKPSYTPKATPPDEASAEQAARDRMRWLHPLYTTLKNSLKLESQMEGIDYTKKNFVHADMTARQFSAMQQQRSEGFLQLWWRSMQAQLTHPEATPASPGLLKILEILCRPDSPTELKRLLGRMFDQVEKLMSGMETEQGSVIIAERNKVALKVMQEELKKGRTHLGIFYGAAHLPDMEQRLLAMGFRREKLEWMTAWDLPPEPPPVKVER